MSSKFIPNSFMVANAFVDDAMNKISDAAVKIYLLIVRKTRGWTKEFDALSLSLLEELSKKSRPTVVRCLKELADVGLVKKHHMSKFGYVYSLLDNYNIGEIVKFPSKKSLLVKEFEPFKNDLVKNFNYPHNQAKLSVDSGYKISGIRLNFADKKSVLVKKFNQSSKNFLLLLVKKFNTQNTTIKKHSQNKKNTWLDFKKLESLICSINEHIEFTEIKTATWFNQELSNFTEYNKTRGHSDDEMLKFFANWMITAYFKYERLTRRPASKPKTASQASTQHQTVGLQPKQIAMFATRLSHDSEYASKFAEVGESREQFAARIARKLEKPSEALKLEKHLRRVGFDGVLALGEMAA
ncbi:hypothetical protein [Acinetobacter brisouii]|uniref:hypothetical protein n=1 Tax=Acinetobacter brisouii TaxID=396323 RepID=UPI00124F16D1|nr:hypothetical protein [Acinetobacter brisouii]